MRLEVDLAQHALAELLLEWIWISYIGHDDYNTTHYA